MTDFYENRAGLDTQVLAQELKKRSSLWQEYVLLDEVDSTNEFIKKMEKKEGLFVLANFQTKGKGRQNRSWIAPKNSSIFISICLKPNKNGNTAWIPLLTSLALFRSLEALTNENIKIKWPNDLVLIKNNEQFKFSGILVEMIEDYAIVGVGINYNQKNEELPITNATSLRTLLNSEILKEEIIASFVSELAALWNEENLATTWPTKASIRDYKTNCVTIGQDINAQLVGKEIIQGTVIDVLDSGELQVKTELKTLNLTSADITLSH
ncbi:MAG: biotin--[acetyl-CoA-carboxylase] ligase [Actinomycetes bacterium]